MREKTVFKTQPLPLHHSTIPRENLKNMSTNKEEELKSAGEENEVIRTFKVIVIGDTNVGKTCLTYRACSSKFPQRTEATIGVDFKDKVLKVNSETIRLQLWDSAGQERFRYSLVPHYYRNVHAVIFVYDVTRKSTFDNLQKWLDEFQCNSSSRNIPRLIIGNKCDLHAEREVRESEAKALASNFGIPLWETSAKSDLESDTIETIFQSLAETLKMKVPLVDFPPHMSTMLQQHRQKGLNVRESLSASSDEKEMKSTTRRKFNNNIKKSKKFEEKKSCCTG